jgi:hypothetical protein
MAFSMPEFQPNLLKPKSDGIKKLFPEPIIVIPEGDLKMPFLKSKVLSEKANSSIDNREYEEALPFINELIKRDPFNRDLYKVRIMINIKLNRLELIDQDDNKIIDFAEGYSIDDLNKDQD